LLLVSGIVTLLSNIINEKLAVEIVDFCRSVAGSCEITAACICGAAACGLSNARTTVDVLLVIRDFQPRLMNYVKALDERRVIVFAVDEWVFERDIDQGFLGEALAEKLVLPYIALTSEDYLHLQEVKVKKRLAVGLLERLSLDFPQLSYEIRIKPEYFMYETMLSRVRVFPPMIYSLLNLLQKSVKKRNTELIMRGYSEALRELEKEDIIAFSNGYVRIGRGLLDRAKSRKTRFTNFFKTVQKSVFASLLGVFQRALNLVSQDRDIFLRRQGNTEENSKLFQQLENPKKYLYIPTARGLVPLSSHMNIEVFARKVLSASKGAAIEVQEIGGVLNDVYLLRTCIDDEEKKVVVKKFKDWSSFKWFPLALWTLGTREFAVLGRSRMEREHAISQLLYETGFAVPKILHTSHDERLIFFEYVEGENLVGVIKRVANSRKGEDIEKELHVINEIGQKLAKVHTLGIALGDSKPENVIIGEKGEIYMLDFEQASRNGDKVWDIAEFLYYAGHYVPPVVGAQSAKLVAKAFIRGYLSAGGEAKLVKGASNPRYTKVFSIFTFPSVILAISNICRKADQLEE
jgi:tRNA A-37 threonylcarbamoyl transferase component Bud32